MSLPPRRILVVDDTADVADALAAALRLLGQTVAVAYDGMSALRLLDEFAADLMILDLSMPVMDGLTLAREIRSRPDCAGVPLIAVSGFGRASDREATRAAGFDHHLVKPIEFGELVRLVAEQR